MVNGSAVSTHRQPSDRSDRAQRKPRPLGGIGNRGEFSHHPSREFAMLGRANPRDTLDYVAEG